MLPSTARDRAAAGATAVAAAAEGRAGIKGEGAVDGSRCVPRLHDRAEN